MINKNEMSESYLTNFLPCEIEVLLKVSHPSISSARDSGEANDINLCKNNSTIFQEGPQEETGSSEEKEQLLHSTSHIKTDNVNGT